MPTHENAIGGICYIKVNGKSLPVAGAVTLSSADVEREIGVGLSGPAGFIERSRAPFIEVEIYDTSKVSLEELQNVRNGSVVAELNNGKVYNMIQACCTTAPELAQAEGTVTLRFESTAREKGLQRIR